MISGKTLWWKWRCVVEGHVTHEHRQVVLIVTAAEWHIQYFSRTTTTQTTKVQLLENDASCWIERLLLVSNWWSSERQSERAAVCALGPLTECKLKLKHRGTVMVGQLSTVGQTECKKWQWVSRQLTDLFAVSASFEWTSTGDGTADRARGWLLNMQHSWQHLTLQYWVEVMLEAPGLLFPPLMLLSANANALFDNNEWSSLRALLCTQWLHQWWWQQTKITREEVVWEGRRWVGWGNTGHHVRGCF